MKAGLARICDLPLNTKLGRKFWQQRSRITTWLNDNAQWLKLLANGMPWIVFAEVRNGYYPLFASIL